MPLSNPIIEGFMFDEINEGEIGRHGLTALQVDQILDNVWAWFPNRKGRTGEYLIVGVDNGGTFISTPIQRYLNTNLWRPVTAWRSKRGEITRYSRRVR